MTSTKRIEQILRFNALALVFFAIVTAVLVWAYFYYPSHWSMGNKTPERIAELTNHSNLDGMREMLRVCLIGEYGDGLMQRKLLSLGLGLASVIAMSVTGLAIHNVVVLRRLLKMEEGRDL